MAADRFVSREEIAYLLDVDVRSVTNYVRKHPDFPSRVRGRDRDFPVQQCLRWKRERDVADAIASLAPPAPSTKRNAEERLAVAQAELAEIKVAKARGEVIPVAQVAKEVRETFTRIRSALQAKPGEYASEFIHLESIAESMPKLQAMIDDVLAELQLRSGAGMDDLDDGGGPDGAGEGADE